LEFSEAGLAIIVMIIKGDILTVAQGMYFQFQLKLDEEKTDKTNKNEWQRKEQEVLFISHLLWCWSQI